MKKHEIVAGLVIIACAIIAGRYMYYWHKEEVGGFALTIFASILTAIMVAWVVGTVLTTVIALFTKDDAFACLSIGFIGTFFIGSFFSYWYFIAYSCRFYFTRDPVIDAFLLMIFGSFAIAIIWGFIFSIFEGHSLNDIGNDPGSWQDNIEVADQEFFGAGISSASKKLITAATKASKEFRKNKMSRRKPASLKYKHYHQ